MDLDEGKKCLCDSEHSRVNGQDTKMFLADVHSRPLLLAYGLQYSHNERGP